jgi:hypothetical protein
MNDTWAAVLAISVAVMALVQVIILAVVGIAARRAMAIAERTQSHVEALAADVKVRVASVTDGVNAVTARVQHAAHTFSDGVQRMEETVRNAGQKVATTIDHVPGSVKKGVPAGLAILAALRTVQQVRQRMRANRARQAYTDDDMYASMHG